jgi:hypothetical protein
MARIYRDGLDAIRRQFLAKRSALQTRDDGLREQAGDVLTKDALDGLDRARAKLDVDLDDLDALLDADEALVGYRLLLRATEPRIDALRAERDRLVPFRRAAKVIALLCVAVSTMGYLGWRHQHDELDAARRAHAAKCQQSSACLDQGQCDAARTTRVLYCVASRDEDCVAARACRVEGRCRASDGTCQATGDADCAASRGCELLGNCAFRYDSCQPTRREHCIDTTGCTQRGLCSFDAWGCTASTRADCASLCTSQGLCSPNDTLCAARSDEDCAASAACRDHGACTARDGRCVAKDAPKCESLRCDAYGLCTPRDGGCVAASHNDCASSDLCARHGRCVAEAGRCVADEASCMGSPGCRELGLCAAKDGVCVEAR